jgi:hypothetical protein
MGYVENVTTAILKDAAATIYEPPLCFTSSASKTTDI